MARNNTLFKKYYKQLKFDENLLNNLTDEEKIKYNSYLLRAVRLKTKDIKDPYEWLDKKGCYMTFDEIAEHLNITPEYCRMIYLNAIKKLKSLCDNKFIHIKEYQYD